MGTTIRLGSLEFKSSSVKSTKPDCFDLLYDNDVAHIEKELRISVPQNFSDGSKYGFFLHGIVGLSIAYAKGAKMP